MLYDAYISPVDQLICAPLTSVFVLRSNMDVPLNTALQSSEATSVQDVGGEMCSISTLGPVLS